MTTNAILLELETRFDYISKYKAIKYIKKFVDERAEIKDIVKAWNKSKFNN